MFAAITSFLFHEKATSSNPRYAGEARLGTEAVPLPYTLPLARPLEKQLLA